MKLTSNQIRALFDRYLQYRQAGNPNTIYHVYVSPNAQNIKAWNEIVDDAESKLFHDIICILVTSKRSFICGYIYHESDGYFFRIINKIECYDIPLNYSEIKNEYTLRGDFYDNI